MTSLRDPDGVVHVDDGGAVTECEVREADVSMLHGEAVSWRGGMALLQDPTGLTHVRSYMRPTGYRETQCESFDHCVYWAPSDLEAVFGCYPTCLRCAIRPYDEAPR